MKSLIAGMCSLSTIFSTYFGISFVSYAWVNRWLYMVIPLCSSLNNSLFNSVVESTSLNLVCEAISPWINSYFVFSLPKMRILSTSKLWLPKLKKPKILTNNQTINYSNKYQNYGKRRREKRISANGAKRLHCIVLGFFFKTISHLWHTFPKRDHSLTSNKLT